MLICILDLLYKCEFERTKPTNVAKTMFSYIITPNLRFSLLCLSLSVAATIIKTSNSTDFHLQSYQLQQSDLNKANFNHDTSSTTSKRHFFFADVNTKIHAKVGEKVELPCLVYGIDIKDVVVSFKNIHILILNQNFVAYSKYIQWSPSL